MAEPTPTPDHAHPESAAHDEISSRRASASHGELASRTELASHGELASRTELLRTVARHAGALTLDTFQLPGLVVERKHDDSPVTRTDRAVEQFIRGAIAAAFPQDGLLGEEFGAEPGESRFTWIIDPIDGTVSFAAGVPLYGVLIGLEERTEAGARIAAGVCELPALGERIWAVRGGGAWWERAGKPAVQARVGTCTDLSRALVCTSGPEYYANDQSRRLGLRVMTAAGRVRGWSDCYAYALAATGRCDAALDPLMHPWDAGPFPVILEEAGGVFTDWTGTPGIRGGNALAANRALHAQIRAMLVE